MGDFAGGDDFGPDEDLFPNRWRNLPRNDHAYPAPMGRSVPKSVDVTVITGIRVNGLNLEYKYRNIKVLAADPESAWTIWHTGTDCPEVP